MNHIKPFLVPQFAVIFLKDFIQTLILMSHLAVLGISLGGSIDREDFHFDFIRKRDDGRADERTDCYRQYEGT
jgi:hypothetical protein